MIIMSKTSKKSLAIIHKRVAKITEDKMLANRPIKHVPLNHKYSIITVISVFITLLLVEIDENFLLSCI